MCMVNMYDVFDEDPEVTRRLCVLSIMEAERRQQQLERGAA